MTPMRGPELAAHLVRAMDAAAAEAGYPSADAMCRRLAQQGQAYAASPYRMARNQLADLQAELALPVPEWHGITTPREREAEINA